MTRTAPALLGGDEKRHPPTKPRPAKPLSDAEQEARRYIASLTRISGAKFLNGAVPLDHKTGFPCAPLQDAVCCVAGKCGHAYSQLMRDGGGLCDECRIEAREQHNADWRRREGIEDNNRDTHERMRAMAHAAGMIGEDQPRFVPSRADKAT